MIGQVTKRARLLPRVHECYTCEVPAIRQVFQDKALALHILQYVVTDTESIERPLLPTMTQRRRILILVGRAVLRSMLDLSFNPDLQEFNSKYAFTWGGSTTRILYREFGSRRVYQLYLHRYLARAAGVVRQLQSLAAEMVVEFDDWGLGWMPGLMTGQPVSWHPLLERMEGFNWGRLESFVRAYYKHTKQFCLEYVAHFGHWSEPQIVNSINPQIALHELKELYAAMKHAWLTHIRPKLVAREPVEGYTPFEFWEEYLWATVVRVCGLTGYHVRGRFGLSLCGDTLNGRLFNTRRLYQELHEGFGEECWFEHEPVEGLFPFEFVASVLEYGEGSVLFSTVCAESPEFAKVAEKILREYREWLRGPDHPSKSVSMTIRWYLTCKYDCWIRRNLTFEEQI